MTVASSPATIHPARDIAAPPLMGETATVVELWAWSDFLDIPACALFRAAQQLVGQDTQH